MNTTTLTLQFANSQPYPANKPLPYHGQILIQPAEYEFNVERGEYYVINKFNCEYPLFTAAELHKLADRIKQTIPLTTT